MSVSAPQARTLEQEEYALWDSFVEESPQGSIFSNSTYLQLLAEASQSRLRIIGCFSDGELVGGCPLLERKRLLSGTYAVSSGPDTPFCGIIYEKADSRRVRKHEMVYNACISALCEYMTKENYGSLSITNSPDLLDMRPFIRQGWGFSLAYTYYIDLDTLSYDDFSSTIKEGIGKAVKNGFSFEKSQSLESHNQLLNEVYDTNHVSPPLNGISLQKFLSFFQISRSGHLRIIKDSTDRPLASYFWVWDKKRAYAWNAVVSPNYHDFGVNHLMIYESLRELKEMGCTEVNIMHANTPHSAAFAAGFNPLLVPYYGVSHTSILNNCLHGMHRIMKRSLLK